MQANERSGSARCTVCMNIRYEVCSMCIHYVSLQYMLMLLSWPKFPYWSPKNAVGVGGEIT